jgi:hypothetical protein
MSKHRPIVLKVDHERCRKVDAKDIAIRWHQMFTPKVALVRIKVEKLVFLRHFPGVPACEYLWQEIVFYTS